MTPSKNEAQVLRNRVGERMLFGSKIGRSSGASVVRAFSPTRLRPS